ncbi:hypothetical protein [Dictyobacter formicarum]|uniref:Peptidase C39-like domain-containing protein n=1 Tax=Dictyobacter formicarum TaxID=2778368 RepID=A0ABQ3VP35_9CHLR|nr:hypothetical protein [Dictyobacter formicarum]GHO87138.1 hypothetical protein KSZ_51440 [Dictyobacter formicarum]
MKVVLTPRWSGLWLFAAVLALMLACTPAAFAASIPMTGPGQNLSYGQLNRAGKSHHTQQNTAWARSKQAYQVVRPGYGVHPLSVPATKTLSTSYSDTIWEPATVGTDAAGHSYTDYYMGQMCGPGATTVALDYWNNVNTRAVGGHNYSDPHVTTYWNDSHERAYMMYIATQVYPPYYTSAGEMSYGSYPNAGTTNQDLTDALNWEASNHNSSNWFTYFYLLVQPGNLSLTTLKNNVASDIANYNVPPVVSVNDAYLPDWSSSPYRGGSHDVAVIGYDNNAGTFTYAETCTAGVCGTAGTGHYTISQQQLYNAIENDNGNGALVW